MCALLTHRPSSSAPLSDARSGQCGAATPLDVVSLVRGLWTSPLWSFGGKCACPSAFYPFFFLLSEASVCGRKCQVKSRWSCAAFGFFFVHNVHDVVLKKRRFEDPVSEYNYNGAASFLFIVSLWVSVSALCASGAFQWCCFLILSPSWEFKSPYCSF